MSNIYDRIAEAAGCTADEAEQACWAVQMEGVMVRVHAKPETVVATLRKLGCLPERDKPFSLHEAMAEALESNVTTVQQASAKLFGRAEGHERLIAIAAFDAELEAEQRFDARRRAMLA